MRNPKVYPVCSDMPEEVKIPKLKEGMGIIIYTDKGPSGVCGQTTQAMAGHAQIHVFKDEASMEDFLKESGNFVKGHRSDIRRFVLGEYGTGNLTFIIH